ncbi:MAG: cyclic nucleotide-binding domain-containing protein, partial [Planctomycetota bacterium]
TITLERSSRKSVFAAFGKYIVEFAFQSGMKSQFHDAKGISEFKANFNGWIQSASLLLMMLSARIIGRFGIRIGLLVLPALQISCTLFILAAGNGLGSPSMVFWLVVMNQGLYKTFSKPIDSPSLKVLYQPLAASMRLAAQIALEAIVTPVTIGAVGSIILVLGHNSVNPVSFSWVILAALGGWITAAVIAYRRYSRALMDALKKRTLGDGTFSLSDESSIAVLRQKLDSDWPGDVIYGLTLLERAEHRSLAENLVKALSHPSPDVRKYSLSRVEALGLGQARDSVTKILSSSAEPSSVRSAAARALCALGGEGIDDAVAPFLSDPDRQLRIGAMVGLLGRTGGTRTAEVRSRIERLARSTDPGDRTLAAQVLAEVPHADFDSLLVELLEDRDPAARRASLAAAGRSNDRRVWHAVIGNLTTPGFSGDAAQVLVAGGEAVLPELAAAFDLPGRRADDLVRLARVVGRIPGEASKRFLLDRLDAGDPRVRLHILSALNRLGFRAERQFSGRIESIFRKEVGESARMLAAISELSSDPECALVIDALAAAVTRSRKRMFLLLSFLHDPATILRASEHVTHEAKEKRAYAVELVDIALSAQQKALLLPLIEDLEPRQRLERLAHEFPQTCRGRNQRLAEIVAWKGGAASSWSRCCALFVIGRLRVRELSDVVASAAGSEDEPIVRDTAAWALAQLEINPGEARNRGGTEMLTIEKVFILKSVSIFAHLAEERLAEIASILAEVDFRPDEPIITKGDVGDSMYIIMHGKVRIHDEGKNLATLGDRDILGEIAILDHQPRLASATAVDDVRALRLDRDAFYELMSDHIEMVTGVLQVLCERLRKLTIAYSGEVDR